MSDVESYAVVPRNGTAVLGGLRSSIPHPITELSEKTSCIPEEKSHGPNRVDISVILFWLVASRRFWVKDPRRPENVY